MPPSVPSSVPQRPTVLPCLRFSASCWLQNYPPSLCPGWGEQLLFFYAPVLHMFGIDIGNAGYVISNLLALSLSFTIIAACIHFTLRVRRQKSEFVKTLTIYNTPIITYYPVTALLGAPATFMVYDALYQVKKQNLPFLQALRSAFDYIKLHQETNAAIITWLAYLSLVSFIVSSLPLVLSSEAMVQIYDNDRPRTYIAIMDGILVGIILGLPIGGAFYIFVAYSFISIP
jgi:hypothetical protein